MSGFKKNSENVLFVVNGEIVDKGTIESYNPEDIKSIDVLKANAAIALYGEKGKNGVIIVTLKNNNGVVNQQLKTEQKPLYVIDGK